MTDSKISVPKDLVIKLERMMCPGACPDYSLIIHGDGKVEYEGRHYVAIKGRRQRWISIAQVKEMIMEFYRINYFSLDDIYNAVANDGAITKTSIRVDGRYKQVINCHPSRAPEDLYNLEKKLDEIVQSEKWVRDRNGRPVLDR
ncbi:MAG: DUF6438 domain-containing protein [Thermoproteota archaeon]